MSRLKNLGKRVVTGLVMLPIVLLFIWFPNTSLPFGAFIGLLVAVGTHEYYRLLRQQDIHPQEIPGVVMATVVALSGLFYELTYTSLTLFAGFTILGFLHVRSKETTLSGLAGSVFGLVYVGWMGAHIVLLHNTPEFGPGLVTLLLVAVALTDVCAFFVGKFLGKHKLAPVVSPNKTWEGAIGGFAGAVGGLGVVYALGVNGTIHVPDWPLGQYLMTGAALSVVAQLGDFVESLLKRAAGVKDAGAIFPGHGGVLDRCDGFLLASPVLYYIAYF